jgi:hypothetical protein
VPEILLESTSPHMFEELRYGIKTGVHGAINYAFC